MERVPAATRLGGFRARARRLVVIAAALLIALQVASTAGAANPPVNASLPSMGGSLRQGDVITAFPGAWSGATPITYGYQWQRCTGTCSNIAGATSSTYTIDNSDVGGTLKVVVTATNVDGSVAATSPASGTIVGAPEPVGMVVAYGGSTLPTGWLWADGAAVSRTTYAELFQVTSTTYGAGDGSTTFNVPDLRERFPIGKAASGTGSTLGGTGGTIDHTHTFTVPSHTHSVTWPAHTHSVPGVGHAHTWTVPGNGYGTSCCGNQTISFGSYATATTTPATVTSTAAGNQTQTTGSATQTATADIDNPPYLVVNYIIKALPNASLPCGAIWGTGRSTAPAGGAFANGAAVSRTGNSALFTCMGTAYGVGDGSTTFNLPEARQRMLIGKAVSGTRSTLGVVGGAIDHTHVVTATGVTHTVSETAHTHSVTTSAHSHSTPWSGSSDHYTCDCTATVKGWIYSASSTSSDGSQTVTSSSSGAQAYTSSSGGAQSPTTDIDNPPFQAINHGVYTAGATRVLDPGMIAGYLGTTAPDGWLLADGTAVSRTTQSSLFSAIGTSFGAGDGSTTFGLPDLRQRFALGVAASGTGATLGGTGGTIDHSHSLTIAAHTHTVADVGTSHTVTTTNHTHTVTLSLNGGYCISVCNIDAGSASWWGIDVATTPVTTTSSGAGTVTSSTDTGGTLTSTSAGGATITSGTANPPFLALNYMVKSAANDVTAPAASAYVNDGTDVDIDGQASLTTITANWAGMADASNVSQYQYCISATTACGGTPVVNWTSTGSSANTLTKTGLSLTIATRYYVCIRASDDLGNGPSAVTCSDGVSTAQNPNAPASLTQFKSDGTTAIASATWTNQSTVVLKFNVSDPDASQTLTPWVEVRTSSSFSGACGVAGAGMYSGTAVSAPTAGVAVAASVTVTGLSDSATYYWRACAVDQTGLVGAFTARGGVPDFKVDATAPANPAQAEIFDLDATWTTDATWSMSTTSLSMSWNVATDPGSGVLSYDACFSTASATCTNIAGTTTITGNTTRKATATATGMTSGITYYTCVRATDNVGNVSAWSCSNGFTIDTGPPTNPTQANIFDLDLSASLDDDWTNNKTALSASWNAGSDSISNIASYDVCFSSVSTGCTNIAGTSTITGNTSRTASATATGMSLLTLYYSCVKARDNAGNLAAAWQCSDGFKVDQAVPSNPAQANIFDLSTTSVDQDWTTSSTSLSASWGIGTDADSGVASYDVCFSTVSSGCTNIAGTSTITGNTSRTAIATATGLVDGTTYYTCIRTWDVAGNQASSWQCSDGFRADLSPPTMPSASGFYDLSTMFTGDLDFTAGSTALSGSWNVAADPISGVATYDVCFSTVNSGCTNIAGTVTQTGNTTRYATATASPAMSSGTTYFTCARAVDVAGNVGSWGCSDGFTVDLTPPVNPTQANIFDLSTTLVDKDFGSSATALSASWNAGSDAVSAVRDYDVCFSSASGTCTAIPGTSIQSGNTSRTAIATATGMTNGSTYYTCIRTYDVVGNVAGWQCSDGFVIDSLAPSVPALISPADSAVLTSTPTLTATYTDAAPATSGNISFSLCSDSACSSVSQSGSSATVASAVNGSWTPAALASGQRYWWRARNVDSAGNTSAWSSIRSFVVDVAPTAPTPVSPASGVWITSQSPTLTATFSDPDAAATGQLQFELCLASVADPWVVNCSSGYSYGTSSAGVASGTNGSWAPNITLVEGTYYYWRVRSADQFGLTSPWASPVRSFRIDSQAPPMPANLVTSDRGTGGITVQWDASVDPIPGSGGVTYNVETSLDGVSWSMTCAATTSLSCNRSGLGQFARVIFRVTACDAVGNCSAPGIQVDTTGGAYYLRSSLNSTILTSTANRKATLPPTGSAVLTAKVQQGATVGWYQFRPNFTLTAPITGQPATSPNVATGNGWVVDDVAGLTMPAGPISMTVATNASNSNSAGYIECRAWKVTTNGSGTITSSTSLGSAYLNAVDVINSATTSQTCSLSGSPNGVSFGAADAIYVEVWMQVTAGSGTSTANVTLTTEDASSFIVLPQAGVPPDVPTLVAPSAGARTSLAPTLQASYSHPSALDGTVEFQVATDPSFASVVQALTTANLTSPSTASVAVSTLAPGTTYYWRARGMDRFARPSSWSSPRTFVTSAQPGAPTNTSPANGGSVALSPTLLATAFSDPDAGASHTASQWQVRDLAGSYLTPVADSGITTTGLTSWASGVSLSDGTTYYWHVRYRDELGVWSDWSTDTSFTAYTTPPMSVDTATPSSAAQGAQAVSLQVNGTGFVSGATVAFSGTDITVVSTTYVSASQLNVTINISSAGTPGSRSITVTNPDLSTATRSAAFTVTAPSISISLSTLGYTSASRTSSAPYTIGFGTMLPGNTRQIGPDTSTGQTTSGAAVQTVVTSDTNYSVQVSAANFTGPGALAASALSWRRSATAQAWTGMTTGASTIEGPIAPGTGSYSYDWRLTVPAMQAAGSYSTTVTYTVIAAF